MEHVGHLPLGQVEGRNLVLADQLHHRRAQPPVAANDLVQQAHMGQMGNSALSLSVGLTAGMEQCEIMGSSGLKILILDLLQNLLAGTDQGHGDSTEGRVVRYQIDRFSG